MVAYITCIDSDYDDPYEGRHFTNIDSLWSTLEKAQERIKELANKHTKELIERCCDPRCPEPCENHKCAYSSFDDADPNKIIIDESYGFSTTFYVIERRMDVPFINGG